MACCPRPWRQASEFLSEIQEKTRLWLSTLFIVCTRPATRRSSNLATTHTLGGYPAWVDAGLCSLFSASQDPLMRFMRGTLPKDAISVCGAHSVYVWSYNTLREAASESENASSCLEKCGNAPHSVFVHSSALSSSPAIRALSLCVYAEISCRAFSTPDQSRR